MSEIDLYALNARIHAAQVYALARRTPCQKVAALSDEKRTIWFKREDRQDVFSFKIRGAANRIAGLTDAERARGVVAASAGNHAQGVASAAAFYGTEALIFMPVTTPPIKVNAVEALGAKTRLIGDSYDSACEAALAYAEETGAVFIHPFDNMDVMAGQGTVGKEILEQMPRRPAAIYVCVGGGGLLAGIGTHMHIESPDTRIFAVEPEGAACLKYALEQGGPTPLGRVDKFADGVAVKQIGAHTFDVARRFTEEVITASNDEICAAVKIIFETVRTVTEPAGGLALAGLLKHIREGKAPEGDIVVTISGANVNFDRIGHIVERAELGAGGEMLFSARIPERAGAFLNFCRALGRRSVSEFNYRLSSGPDAHVLVGVKLSDPSEREAVIADMKTEGITVTDLSYDRFAKRHLRHAVGGRAEAAGAEKIFRFEFPERPGALVEFLENLDARWNISLFHYRNHGHSSGHVLCGFQVPNGDGDALTQVLQAIGYPMRDESDNPAVVDFLIG